ncbi:hypothetical protein IW262DRAFT_1300950 [Armillaria fumosa]|nr:hypothetical protein IW262DRAFT_1300950 [Armillaria fumosa]
MANHVQRSLFLRGSLLIGFTRLPSVLGDDAVEWNPCQFLEDCGIKQESLGTYVNLMSFSSGVHGCLGVMAVQSVVTELLSNFEFTIPQKGAPELQHGPAGAALIPIVPGKTNEGPQVDAMRLPDSTIVSTINRVTANQCSRYA